MDGPGNTFTLVCPVFEPKLPDSIDLDGRQRIIHSAATGYFLLTSPALWPWKPNTTFTVLLSDALATTSLACFPKICSQKTTRVSRNISYSGGQTHVDFFTPRRTLSLVHPAC